MEFNDYFGTIREFYKTKKFCDLKIVAVPDDLESYEASPNAPPVFCHSLVLISAIPELKFCIQTNQENEEDHLTIFLYNSSHAEIENIILDIYNVLAAHDHKSSNSDNDYYSKCHQRWVELFGFQPNKKTPIICESLTEGTKNNVSTMVRSVSNQSVKKEPILDQPQLVELQNNLSLDGQINTERNDKILETVQFQQDNNHSLMKDGPTINENSMSNKENNSNPISFQSDGTNNLIINTTSKNNAHITDNHLKSVSTDIKHKEAPREATENNETNLVVPVKNVKKGYKERTCLDCNKTFPFNTKGQKSAYQEHISSHFKCDCNIAFGDRKAFKLHIKSIHKGRSGRSIQKIGVDGITKIKMKKDKPIFR